MKDQFDDVIGCLRQAKIHLCEGRKFDEDASKVIDAIETAEIWLHGLEDVIVQIRKRYEKMEDELAQGSPIELDEYPDSGKGEE